MTETSQTIEDILGQHLPVIVQHGDHVTNGGCACGQVPLDHTEHVARKIAEHVEEIDRNARAYGWAVGRGAPLAAQIDSPDGNPFHDPDWRDHLAPRPICPECAQGKHRNCDGTAWDPEADAPTLCRCDDDEGDR